MKKVCMVVPNSMVKGGIAAVVNGYRGSQLEKDYDVIYVESYKDGGKLTKLLKAINGYFHFLKVILIDKPDLIHIHSSFGPSFYRKLPFIYMASQAKIPIINHIHGADFDEFYVKASTKKKDLIKKVYGKCSKLIALSAEWKKQLSTIVPASKIIIIENYSVLYEDAFQERQKRSCNNQVLFLGELGKRKGCYDIPAVAKLVAEEIPHVKFLLCGTGNETDEKAIRKLIKEKNVETNFVFAGWIRNEKKDRALRDSDIFFLPSYNEGMPMSILDAMGYGLPIVSTDIGGIPQIVRNGENGYILSPGDIRAMSDVIRYLLQHPDKSKLMGKESMKIINNKFSLQIHEKKLSQLYSNLLGE